jgi:hypothetical protein
MRWRFLLPFLTAIVVVGGLGGLVACTRPSEEDCRRALLNVQKIRGLADSANAPDPEPAVRKCRSTASTEQVACLTAARTDKDVAACQQK